MQNFKVTFRVIVHFVHEANILFYRAVSSYFWFWLAPSQRWPIFHQEDGSASYQPHLVCLTHSTSNARGVILNRTEHALSPVPFFSKQTDKPCNWNSANCSIWKQLIDYPASTSVLSIIKHTVSKRFPSWPTNWFQSRRTATICQDYAKTQTVALFRGGIRASSHCLRDLKLFTV